MNEFPASDRSEHQVIKFLVFVAPRPEGNARREVIILKMLINVSPLPTRSNTSSITSGVFFVGLGLRSFGIHHLKASAWERWPFLGISKEGSNGHHVHGDQNVSDDAPISNGTFADHN